MLDKTDDPVSESDANVADQIEASGETVTIKVTKGGTIDVDIGRLPDRIYKAVILHGLNKLVNRKTKGNATDKDGKPLNPDIRATQNLEAMYADTYKLVGSKTDSGKASGPVMVEARRLAILMVKAEMKAQKIKVTHIPKPQITALANELIDSDPSIVKTAEANLKAAEDAVASKKTSKLVFKPDPKLVAAAAEKKAKDKSTKGQTLSAKQAGKVQVKSKPQATK